jgi:hypothetical protein
MPYEGHILKAFARTLLTYAYVTQRQRASVPGNTASGGTRLPDPVSESDQWPLDAIQVDALRPPQVLGYGR